MIDLGQILVGLLLRTSEGKLKWSPMATNNRFVTSIDAISIVITEVEVRGVNHRLDILDESGEPIESLVYKDTTPDQDEQLARLYVLARRSALDIESTLEKLAKALEL